MQTIRVFFTKKGESAYISHLDLQRVMARAFRKSGLPVWYSQGFNPHIYMSFALPLPLGQESEAETVDCKTESEEGDFSAFLQPLNQALPRGIRAESIALPVHKPVEIQYAEYRIDYELPRETLREILEKYQSLEAAPVLHKRKKTEETIDLRVQIKNLELGEDGSFTALFPAGNDHTINPFIFTDFLENTFTLPKNGVGILRKKVLINEWEKFC